MRSSVVRGVEHVLTRLAAIQVARPWRPIVLCLTLAAIGAILATRLELRTRFDQLLPEHEPSVVELKRVDALTSGSSNIFVVLEGGDRTARRAMADALVPRLRSVGPPWIVSAEDGVQTARAFLLPRAGMFAKTSDLAALRDDVEARWDWEIGVQTGSNLSDDEPPPITADAIRKRFGTTEDEAFRDGYYESKDGATLVVISRAAVASGALDRAREAFSRVKNTVDEVHRQGGFAAVRVGYAGDLVTGLSEYGAVKDDLVSVGALGVALVLGVILLFFLRLRALFAMGVTIAVGLAWTFGMTELAIGHLNVATGFLVSIVAGNGINFGIIYIARFFEERRQGHAIAEAVLAAHRSTWLSTSTAALAAAASYGSLGVTDFRAFKHFAFIGSAGMILCWLATYAMLPAILVLVERVLPFVRQGESEAAATGWRALRLRGIRFDAPFTRLVARAPGGIAVTGVAIACAGLALVVPYVRSDPMEYDMRRLQNDLGGSGEMYRVSALAADVLGANLESAMVIVTERVDQVVSLKATLEARRDAASEAEKPFEAVHTLLDFVAADQTAKIPILRDLRTRLVRAHERGMVSDADWSELAKTMPPADLAPWTLADLPPDLARPFTERDGTRGRIVFIEPTAGKNDSDLRYLLRWADAFRETTLPNGEIVRGSGRAVIFADMLRAVVKDVPRAIALSLAMTVLTVLITFRRVARWGAVLAALGVGLGWLALAMAATHLAINFFNFVALPITFGIGVDYAVNLVQRYDLDPDAGIARVLESTGGAVILCSLTTTLGYLALLGSINQAIRGLGLLAVIGEVCCLFAAVLVLPSLIILRSRNRILRASRRAAVKPKRSIV